MQKEMLRRLAFWNIRRNIKRFIVPLSVLFASKSKVDAGNLRSIELARKKNEEVTVLLHGIMTTYYTGPYWILRWFQENGVPIVSIGYDYRNDLATSAQEVKEKIDQVMKEAGCTKINLIGISLGGQVARYYVEKLGGKDVVDKLVTVFTPIATPTKKHASLAFRIFEFVDPKSAHASLELGRSIERSFSVQHHLALYGTHDWIVGKDGYPLSFAPASVEQRQIPGGHLFVTYNVDAMENVLLYLDEIRAIQKGIVYG